MTHIKYIGHRAPYRDGACGSGLTFERGQTLLVEDEFAKKMLRHPSVYVRDDTADISGQPAKPAKTHLDDDDPDQTARDAIANMNKGALATYAKTTFNVNLDGRKNIGELRAQVTGLFDQFGVE